MLAQADRNYSAADAQVPARQPLTMEIMDRTAGSVDTAREVHARLNSLRDRLFGAELSPGHGDEVKGASPSGFSDAYSAKAAELRWLLVQIDQITIELNNRL